MLRVVPDEIRRDMILPLHELGFPMRNMDADTSRISSRSANDSAAAGEGPSGNNSASSILRGVPDDGMILPLHELGFSRNMEADNDDGGLDNGQDDEDASEQDDPMPPEHQRSGDRDRPLMNHQRSNIDDEVVNCNCFQF